MSNKNIKEQILTYAIDDLISDRFSRYAKYIILDRALPDVRDGLKPVQRRILYAMNDLGLVAEKPYKKSARVVGEVIGKYHPHGDSSVYSAMVRMAQTWKSLLPLVDMQGNKGSIDGDGPAAMRYTEARLSFGAQLLLFDLKKNVVNFVNNFDESEKEPVVLPAYFPNLLVNGSTGIAVGIATNIPPHNLGEVINSIVYRIKNPTSTLSEIIRTGIKGPDFPTGGVIQGIQGIKNAYKTGKGRIAIRAKTTIEQSPYNSNETRIVIHELPYEVVKQDLVKKIDEVRELNKINGIKEVRDETDRKGLRIVIDLTKEANSTEVLNYLLKNTNLQVFYNLNLVAIANNKPQQLSLINILDHYINHQVEVITRRSKFDLDSLQEKLEIINGLIIALNNISIVIELIRTSENKNHAKEKLIARFNFTQLQAEAIVQLRLYRLTATDVNSLINEKVEIEKNIIYLKNILSDRNFLNEVLINKLIEIKEQFSLKRKSSINGEITEIVINEKATIKETNLFVSVSYDGWIKAINENIKEKKEYEEFGRKPDDVIIAVGNVNSLDNLLLITNKGNYIVLPCYKLQENRWKDIGMHLNSLVKLDILEKVVACAVINDFSQDFNLLLATKLGFIKKVALSQLETTRYLRTIKCMGLANNDQVVFASFTSGKEWVLLTTNSGFSLKYLESNVNVLGLSAKGIKAAKLTKEDYLVGGATGYSEEVYGTVTKNGEFKRMSFSSIAQTNRTTKGQKTFKPVKNKPLMVVNSFKANDEYYINYVNKSEKWKYLKASAVIVSRVGESNGKMISDNIINAYNIKLWNLKK